MSESRRYIDDPDEAGPDGPKPVTMESLREIGMIKEDGSPGDLKVEWHSVSQREYKDERLNLGSGKWSLDGWINIDAVISPMATRSPDIICDLRDIPLPSGCAKEAMAIHVFEHIDRWDAERTLLEWARLLKRGGKLVLEMPDLIKCCRNVINGTQGKKPDQLGMWGLYGEPVGPPMQHKWAYTFKTIQPMLEQAGFIGISEQRTMFHLSGRDIRDFRVEAIKA